jgi:hypothetical protein
MTRSMGEGKPRGTLMGLRVEDGGRGECLPVMGRIGVALSGFGRERNQAATSLHAKAG